MLASFLMGLVGGQRAMTPLAAVAIAAARDALPADNGAPRLLAYPAVAVGAVALAIGELAGDKQKTAPDRIVPIGLAARFVTSAIAGASLAPRRQRWLGAAVGGITAVAASYPGWRARMKAMKRHGQTSTGLVEDAAVIAGAGAIILMQARAASSSTPDRGSRRPLGARGMERHLPIRAPHAAASAQADVPPDRRLSG